MPANALATRWPISTTAPHETCVRLPTRSSAPTQTAAGKFAKREVAPVSTTGRPRCPPRSWLRLAPSWLRLARALLRLARAALQERTGHLPAARSPAPPVRPGLVSRFRRYRGRPRRRSPPRRPVPSHLVRLRFRPERWHHRVAGHLVPVVDPLDLAVDPLDLAVGRTATGVDPLVQVVGRPDRVVGIRHRLRPAPLARDHDPAR